MKTKRYYVWEFATCERPDGSLYGSPSPNCLKGAVTQLPAEEEGKKKAWWNKPIGGKGGLLEELKNRKEKGIFETSSIEEALEMEGNGVPTKRGKEVDDGAVRKYNSSRDVDKPLIESLKKEGLSDGEAQGLAALISQNKGKAEKYTGDNAEKSKLQEDIELRAASALSKLKKYNPIDLEDSLQQKKNQIDRVEVTGELKRGVTVPVDKLEEFLSPYRKALSEDSEIKEKSPVNTTAMIGSTELTGANVIFKIQSIYDSTGKGVMIEDFKPEKWNSTYRGNVIYPPGTRFRVTGIQDAKGRPPVKLDSLTSEDLAKIPTKMLRTKNASSGQVDWEKGGQKLLNATVMYNALKKAKDAGEQSGISFQENRLKKLGLDPDSPPPDDVLKKLLKIQRKHTKDANSDPAIGNVTTVFLTEERDFLPPPEE